ncbi:MAG: cytochrome c [Bdellovibrionales bacterium]|nr:cytochrome c [Bdellovibrionales bacterium]
MISFSKTLLKQGMPKAQGLFCVVCGLVALCLATLTLVGCDSKHTEPNVELVQNMMESPAIKAQDFDNDVEDYRANLLPPEGSVPKGVTPYAIQTPDEAAEKVTNPYAGKMDTLARGQELYFINCAVCHGTLGKGDGTVASYFVLTPPSLLSEKARGFKDGYIYHLVVMGRGMMDGYGSQIIKERDRWAVVNYVRHLQKTLNAPAAPAAGGN